MSELVQQLVSTVGVNEEQAQGGMGLILGMLKDKLGADDFSQLSEVLPETDGLIARAPAASGGGIGGMLGGAVSAFAGGDSALGDLAKLASGFSGLGLDAGMLGKFIPVLTGFIESKGASGLVGRISEILQGD